jgi:hypothetical protein
LSSCTKSETYEKEKLKENLIQEVADIANSNVNPTDPDDFLLTNMDNPYEVAGIITGRTIYQILSKARESRSASAERGCMDFKKTLYKSIFFIPILPSPPPSKKNPGENQ